MTETIFWLCAVMIVYSYVLYAPLVWVLSRLFGSAPHAVRNSRLPSVSLLIAAHDEQEVIEARLQNAMQCDYPRERLEIVVASDGSTDATAAIVKRYVKHGVTLFEYARRRGKSAVLNETIPELGGEIVVLSDANTSIEPSAIRMLVRWFQDPTVGAVCGKLVLSDPASGGNVDGMYWKYETFLKRCESRLGALLGSNGAIYALRRDLYQSIPSGTLVDDFVIPLLAKMRTGCAIIYDTQAIAREQTAVNVSSEFGRRSRIGAGGFQSMLLLWRLLSPRRGWIALTFFSHKILRWLCPFFMIGLIVTNVALLLSPAPRPIYRATAIAQLTFYLLSMLAAWLPSRTRALRALRLTTMFTLMNAALLVGFFRWLLGGESGAWKRTER